LRWTPAREKLRWQGWKKSLARAPQEVMAALAPYCGGVSLHDVDREGTMTGAN